MAEEKKKRKGRRAYLEDFQKTASGEYVYTGLCYTYEERGMTFRRSMAVRWALAGGAAVFALLGGFLPAPGMGGCFYVLMPYVAGMAAAASMVWAAARIAYWGGTLREYVYEKTVTVLPTRCVAAAVFSAVTLTGEVVYLLRNGNDGVSVPYIILFFVLQTGVLCCAIGLRQFERRQIWSK